ncbi:YfbK domain-containing protein, partial [Magnetococcales bacterium HHB-1]
MAASVMPVPGMMGIEPPVMPKIDQDKFESFDINPVRRPSEKPVSTFSVDVDTASYSYLRKQINRGNLPRSSAIRVEELINYFDYAYALPESADVPFKPTVAVYPNPWNPESKLLQIGIKGYMAPTKTKPKSNLVFLLDVSGSMRSEDKLPLLKKSLGLLINTLNPDDSVAIVVYAGAAGTVLDPTLVKDKHKILSALDRLEAGGSTAGGAGIQLAYSLAEGRRQEGAVNRVILATDGDFNVGMSNPSELKEMISSKRKSGVFLSVLGFGRGNYNDHMMQALAQNGNGVAAYIDSLSEARKVLVEEASANLFTIAKDTKIQIEFNPKRVAEYRLIGYETR